MRDPGNEVGFQKKIQRTVFIQFIQFYIHASDNPSIHSCHLFSSSSRFLFVFFIILFAMKELGSSSNLRSLQTRSQMTDATSFSPENEVVSKEPERWSSWYALDQCRDQIGLSNKMNFIKLYFNNNNKKNIYAKMR